MGGMRKFRGLWDPTSTNKVVSALGLFAGLDAFIDHPSRYGEKQLALTPATLEGGKQCQRDRPAVSRNNFIGRLRAMRENQIDHRSFRRIDDIERNQRYCPG